MCDSCATGLAKISQSFSRSGRNKTSNTSTTQFLNDIDVEPIVQVVQIIKSPSRKSFDAKYEVVGGSVLGSGMSGAVRVARARRTGADVALKILPTANLSPIRREQTLSEVQNQLSMRHPHICALLEVYEEPDLLKLVIERLHGVNVLEDFNNKGGYSEGESSIIVRQMLMAVAYCHKMGVCHKDLKPENFCFEDDSDIARLKMIDFGLSEAFSSSIPMTHACGSLYYVAPEVLRQKYTEKCDIWSVGVITYILLEGRRPFEGSDDRATVMQIRSGKYLPLSKIYTKRAHEFVNTLLRVDPNLRPSAEAALSLEWITRAAERLEKRRSDANAEVKFDPALLRGMRKFSRCDALKQTLLGALAPVATAQEVARWADQFEALDTQGTGFIPVAELAKTLKDETKCSKEEAEALSNALAGVEGEDELVSYQAFLSACLCSHMTLEERDVQELFHRLDVDNDGRISLEEFRSALGDVVDTADMELDIDKDGISFGTFKCLLLLPRPQNGQKGLKQLLNTCGDGHKDWGVAAARAKHGEKKDDAAEIEAARAENILWRKMALEKGKDAAPSSFPEKSEVQPKKPSDESFDDGLNVQELKKKMRDNEEAFVGDWRVATTEAKDGEIEAARRENMAWRIQAQQEQARKKEATAKTGRCVIA